MSRQLNGLAGMMNAGMMQGADDPMASVGKELWQLQAGLMVVPALLGFALLEAARTKSEDRHLIVVSRLISLATGLLGYWVFGFGFLFGEDNFRGEVDPHEPNQVNPKANGGFIGTSKFLAGEGALYKDDEQNDYPAYFLNFARLAVVLSIVAYAFAGRFRMESTAVMAMGVSTLLFPVVGHWVFDHHGMLELNKFIDCGGASAIHVVAGVFSLIGAAVLGRNKQSDAASEESEEKTGDKMLTYMGALCIWVGSYGLNAGSASPSGPAAGRAFVNTTFAALAGAAGAAAFNSGLAKKLVMCNWTTGLIGGLAAIAGCAQNTTIFNAILIGSVAGALVEATKMMLAKYNAAPMIMGIKLEDPKNVYAVHGATGIWGVFAAGFFDLSGGFFHGKNFSKGFGPNMTGLFVILLWTTFMAACMFLAFEKLEMHLADKPSASANDVEVVDDKEMKAVVSTQAAPAAEDKKEEEP